MIDIEAIVKKHTNKTGWAFAHDSCEKSMRAALTELADGYEQKIAGLEDVLRALACSLSAGGYNSNVVDTTVFERKIRDGIGMITAPLQERIRQLEARLGGYLTVGGGHIVHGTAEALARVQAYILLDSKHPIEERDTNRYFAKRLQAAEQRIRQLEAERVPYSGPTGEWRTVDSERPDEGEQVMVACCFDHPSDWRIKIGEYLPNHPDTGKTGWKLYGASWEPTHWMPLPEAPQPKKEPRHD